MSVQLAIFGPPPPPPASELQAKRQALEALESSRRAEIERVASIARQVWYKKEALGITIDGRILICADEVRAAAGIFTDREGKKNNFMGCIFTARILGKRKFKPVYEAGQHASTTPGSHYNRILYWTLTEEIWK